MRIGSFNLYNCFDADEQGHRAKTTRAFRSLCYAINGLEADVLCVQEIGSTPELHRINTALYQPYEFVAVVNGNDHRGMHLGVLSRLPVEVKSHRDHALQGASGEPLFDYGSDDDARLDKPAPLRVQRDIMLCELAVEGRGVVALFNLHLKSHYQSRWRLLDNDVIRMAEVGAVIDVVRAYWHDNDPLGTVVLGDLNDEPMNQSICRLCESLALKDVLAEDWIAKGQYPNYTWRQQRSQSRLDYLLLDQRALAMYEPASAQIHVSAAIRKASDHYPVSLVLNLP